MLTSEKILMTDIMCTKFYDILIQSKLLLLIPSMNRIKYLHFFVLAYVALGQFLDEKNEIERMMNMSSIQRVWIFVYVCLRVLLSSKLID